MQDDPKAFIQEFEAKFEAHKNKSRLEFLVHFRPREFHFYALVLAELKLKYRAKPPFASMIRRFPMAHWQEVVLELLDRFAQKPDKEPAESGIENGKTLLRTVVRQFPQFFADYMDKLFLAGIDFHGHRRTYMWQNFGHAYAVFLQAYVGRHEHDYDAQCRALSKALLTSDQSLKRWAIHYINHELKVPRKKIMGLNLTEELLNKHLHEQGLEWKGTGLRRLYPEYAHHVIFPEGFLDTDTSHETYQPHSLRPDEHLFGGYMKARNAAGVTTRIQHLISLDPIPDFLKITGMHRLVLACDMDLVLKGKEVFHRHMPNGAIIVAEDARKYAPANGSYHAPVHPFFKGAKVRLSDHGPAWYFSDYSPETNMFRVGGPPAFVQEVHYPECTYCGDTMQFLLQLGHGIPLANGRTHEWGEKGLAHVYWCDDCNVSCVSWWSE